MKFNPNKILMLNDEIELKNWLKMNKKRLKLTRVYRQTRDLSYEIQIT